MRAFLAGVMAVAGLCAPAHAADGALSREGFLAALQAAQDRVSNIEYVVSGKRYMIESTSGEVRPTPYFYNARIVMAGAPGGRMRYERDSVVPWHLNSTSPEQPIPMVDWFAFDGKTATTVAWRAVLGRTKVQTLPSWQTIKRARDSNELTMYECIPTALMLIPTYYQDAGLAQTIARFKDWRLTHNTDGTYVVRYTDALVFDRRITVDLSRGGAITGIVEGPEGTRVSKSAMSCSGTAETVFGCPNRRSCGAIASSGAIPSRKSRSTSLFRTRCSGLSSTRPAW